MAFGDIIENLRAGKTEEARRLALELPEAVPAELICRDEADLDERAEAIVEIMLGSDLAGRRFLDFGCGDGRVVSRVAALGADAYGYDTQADPHWADAHGTFMTRPDGKYDVILAHDVLDHAFDPVAAIKDILSLAAPGAFVAVRLHPWCSRHGSHIYRELNVAFAHLLFSDDELHDLGALDDSPHRVMYPMARYGEWFRQAGLQTPQFQITRDEPEGVFSNDPEASRRIKARWKTGGFPAFQLGQSWVDAFLRP